MKSLILATLAGAIALASATAKEVGQAAPDFKAKDIQGKEVSLADLKGKVVVLEWSNFECPFVKKHYAGNMQKLQGDYTGKGVVWVTINSAAEGKQGYLEASKMAEAVTEKGSKASNYILDTDGKIGKAYDAKTTPHMFIIGKDGKLAYNGAIDSKATTEEADIATADKTFANALDSVIDGKTVVDAKNAPYGCGVKY